MATSSRIRPQANPVVRLAIAVALISLPATLSAQPARINGRINSAQWTPLRGNVHPATQSAVDQGEAPESLQLSSVTLVLKPSASQQAALDQLLADQQNPASQSYHKWLTPEEFADRFGASQSDIDKMTAWAQSAQLTVTGVARGRNSITVKGTAAQVGSALHTQIHLYQADGKTHFANSTEPSVPAAMQDVVQAIHGLHNFRMQPRAHKMVALGVAADGVTPNYTSTSGNHYLGPDDFATIFNLAPLYNAGINGSGQTIAVVGQSQIVPAHISTFATYFGLSAASLTTQLVPNTVDPGISESDEQESDLDLQWAFAIARGANLKFVYSYDVTDAVHYVIDQNLAPVVSMSYGLCETSSTRSDSVSMSAWAQQGSAQGITWVASSGDSGAAGCYSASTGGSRGVANLNLAVGLPASVPQVTAVGGTTLSEGGGVYWNGTNTSAKGSAVSYIPEVAWNDSVADGSPSASGGGASQFFTKPSWQTGTGVPNDGARDVPDVSFPASPNHDGYMVYSTSSGKGGWFVFGGTSCGAPAFSGVLALLNQYLVSNGFQSAAGLGNVNSHLYSFATSTPSAFHDVTSGNNMVTACTTTRCTSSSTSGGFTAGAGYDLVTGLGSIDAYRFVAAWHTGVLPKSTPTIALAATPNSLGAGGTATLTATVTSSDGSTPTGSVTFSAGSATLGSAQLTGTSGTAMAVLTVSGSAAGLVVSTNTITAVYDGDASHNAATTVTTLTVVTNSAPAITAVADSASFRQAFAPGMLTSVFGSGLSLTTNIINSTPLPAALDNVSATVNGIPAPLLYISPTQLNLQIPYETPSSGNVTLVVSNNGLTASASIPMSAAAPGIFADSNGALLPATSVARGQMATLYFTGAGAISPTVATGSTPGGGTAPAPVGNTLVTVGGVQASTSYVAIPSWSVGVVQVNFTVPATVSTGVQPVVVSVGGLAGVSATITVN